MATSNRLSLKPSGEAADIVKGSIFFTTLSCYRPAPAAFGRNESAWHYGHDGRKARS
jgi:hypothetical protein